MKNQSIEQIMRRTMASMKEPLSELPFARSRLHVALQSDAISLPDSDNIFDKSDDEVCNKLRKWARQGVKLEAPVVELNGATLLESAIINHASISVIKALEESGVDLNHPLHGISPASLAIKKGSLDTANYIVERSSAASVNLLDESGKYNAYMLSALRNDPSLLKKTWESGGDPTYETLFGDNVLMHYLKNAKPLRKEVVEEIFSQVTEKYAGTETADPIESFLRHKDKSGLGAVSYLVRRMGSDREEVSENMLSIMSILLAHKANTNQPDKKAYRPLHWAATDGNIPAAEMLIAHGGLVNAHNIHGDSPLSLAVKFGHLKMAKFLVENGADLNTGHPRHPHKLPLLRALRKDNSVMAEMLLLLGADPNITDPANDNESPLITAVKRGYSDTAALLISSGAKVDYADDNGQTALMHAVEAYQSKPDEMKKMIKLLQDNGASLTKENSRGENIVDILERNELVGELGSIVFQRNLEYIANNYFHGDVKEARRAIVKTTETDAYARLHEHCAEEDAAFVQYLTDSAEVFNDGQDERIQQGRRSLMGTGLAAAVALASGNALDLGSYGGDKIATALNIPGELVGAGLLTAGLIAWYLNVDKDTRENIKLYAQYEYNRASEVCRKIKTAIDDGIASVDGFRKDVLQVAYEKAVDIRYGFGRLCACLASPFKALKSLFSGQPSNKDISDDRAVSDSLEYAGSSHSDKAKLLLSEGRELPEEIREDLMRRLEARGLSNVTEVVSALDDCLSDMSKPKPEILSKKIDSEEFIP